VRQTAGAVPAPVQLILAQAADGVRLTPGGRLPRAFVRRIQQHYPHWHPLDDRAASREEDLPPLASLHELLCDVGLLRLRHGVLSPTRAASNQTEVIRRLRSWFGPDAGFTSILAGGSLAVLAARGTLSLGELAQQVHPWLGDDWITHDGDRLTNGDVHTALAMLTLELEALDLIHADMSTWRPGPSARWLLPRATGLAHLWANQLEAIPTA
jgi:hypothetical protein